MGNQSTFGFWYAGVVWAMVVFSVLAFGYGFFENGFTEEGVRHSIRWSARVSVVLFSLAFSASAIQVFWKNSFTFWQRMNRRHLGISFAISHLFHLSWLVVLQQSFHPVFDRAKTISLLGGGLAYLFLVLMLLTSFPYFSKRLSPKNWSLLHTVGGWWIWFIFVRSYGRGVFEGNMYDLPFLMILVLVFVLRVAKFFKR